MGYLKYGKCLRKSNFRGILEFLVGYFKSGVGFISRRWREIPAYGGKTHFFVRVRSLHWVGFEF